ncbi:hypothetical protein H0A71_22315 [Alcaligenaceae bacterium]|nr:hypothetical protein [Alcaligenaceae bacterium]
MGRVSFAVVASEVHTLAQRSADAAREIKTLIDESIAGADKGEHQVVRAGQIMQEVVSSVAKVTSTIAEITLASNEQSAGVGEVSAAVAQLDSVTQQNASLVNESAVSAASLRQMTSELPRLMF